MKKKMKVCKGCIYFETCGDVERTEPCKGKKTRREELEEQLSSIEKRIDNMFADFPTKELRRELIFNTPQFDELVMERKSIKAELDRLVCLEELELKMGV